MIELLRRLDPMRWSVHVACFHAAGDWFGRVSAVAESVTAFPVRSFRSFDAARQMRAFARWCRRRELAVVHTTELPSNIFGLLPAALAGVPVRIANRREINPDKSAAEIAAQRAAYTLAHKVVANSRAAADRLRRERVPPKKIAIIPNGLDSSDFKPRAPRPTRRRVVVVANLRPEKAHDVLIDAAPEILRRHQDISFEFVGGGHERERLIERARARAVLERVTFAGHCHDVAARLRAADIFVLPSRSEAFPNAVLEAMAAGLPVVASRVGGICELIEHEQTGLLVAPDDPHALADQICRLADDTALADRLGGSARAHALTHYSFERMVNQFEQLYLNELAVRSAAEYGAAIQRGGDEGAPSPQPCTGARRLQPSEKVSL